MANDKDPFAAGTDDVLQEKIKQYRAMLKKQKPEMDVELLFRILRIMNDESEVKIAVDPIAEDGQWEKDARTYAVAGVVELDDGRVALRATREKHGIKVGDLEHKLKKAFKRSRGSGKPVLFVHDETVAQLTDAYSHALVREKWAGLPFDLVLAMRNDDQKSE